MIRIYYKNSSHSVVGFNWRVNHLFAGSTLFVCCCDRIVLLIITHIVGVHLRQTEPQYGVECGLSPCAVYKDA